MTGHPDPPGLARRRHVDRLRAELELTSVPTHVGSELHTVTPLVREQLRLRVPADALPAALSADAQQRLFSALAASADEFAYVVANRPVPAPRVEALLVEMVRAHEAGPGQGALEDALDTVFGTLRDMMREQWERLPWARSHAQRLDEAWERYVARLRTTAASPPRRPRHGPRTDETRPEDVLAEAERRWGGTTVMLCVVVGAVPTLDRSATVPLRPIAARRGPARGSLRCVTTDHVVVITEHRTRAQRTSRTKRADRASEPVAIGVGPVTADQLVAAYETALLSFRLVGAGVAAPRPPTMLPLPSLGFLRARPTETAVAEIADLLGPLTQQSSARRRTLARTLQLRLRTGGTIQALADHLSLHPRSVGNHLAALRELFDNDELDFGPDTLTIQAALDLVLPLWELESSRRRSVSVHDTRQQPTTRAPRRDLL